MQTESATGDRVVKYLKWSDATIDFLNECVLTLSYSKENQNINIGLINKNNAGVFKTISLTKFLTQSGIPLEHIQKYLIEKI